MARRAGVPSGEARRVILRGLELWVSLEAEKSVQKCQCDTQILDQISSDFNSDETAPHLWFETVQGKFDPSQSELVWWGNGRGNLWFCRTEWLSWGSWGQNPRHSQIFQAQWMIKISLNIEAVTWNLIKNWIISPGLGTLVFNHSGLNLHGSKSRGPLRGSSKSNSAWLGIMGQFGSRKIGSRVSVWYTKFGSD